MPPPSSTEGFTLDWPLSRDEKKGYLLRLYDKDVRAANVLLQSSEHARQALREELHSERRRSWGCPMRPTATELDFGAMEEASPCQELSSAKHDEVAQRPELDRCLRETITNMKETLGSLLHEDAARSSKVTPRAFPNPVSGADDGAGKAVHHQLPPEIRVGLQKLCRQVETLSGQAETPAPVTPDRTPERIRGPDPGMAEGKVPPLRWAPERAVSSCLVVPDMKDMRQLSRSSRHELSARSAHNSERSNSLPCSKKEPLVMVTTRRRRSRHMCSWLC